MKRLFFIVITVGLLPCLSNAGILHVAQKPRPNIDRELQFQTISEAAKQVEPGDTVTIHGGTYREKVIIEKNGTAEQPIVFQAGEGEYVVVTGTDIITDWKRESSKENTFSTGWPYQFITWNEHHTHPSDDFHLIIGRSEQVFVERYPMKQVLDRDKLSRGTFYVDLDGKRLYVWSHNNTDLSSKRVRVEASTRDQVWIVTGDYVQVNGIRFRYAANRAQQGAADFKGKFDRSKKKRARLESRSADSEQHFGLQPGCAILGMVRYRRSTSLASRNAK